SEFVVRLPEVASPPRANSSRRAKGVAAGARRHVLIVDDNEDAAASLRMMLALEGHQVHVVNEGLHAEAAVEEHDPEVVLLDIGLPDLDGYSVARKLRARANGRRLRIIAISGYGSEE